MKDRLQNWRDYLNDDGELSEEFIRDDSLILLRDRMESEIAERLEQALDGERELVNADGSSTFLPDEEIELLRGSFEEEIRVELEEEFENDLEEAVAEKLDEFAEQRADDELAEEF